MAAAVKSQMFEKLDGLAPFEQVMSLHDDRTAFFKEFHNYMQGGLVLSTPELFLMMKPVDSSKDPSGQWWVKKPDAWYCRWAAGRGALKAMFNQVTPMPKLMFRRVTPAGTSKLKTYSWDRIFKKVNYG